MSSEVPGAGATYRIQLGPDFGFDKAAEVFPYLAELGIETVYLSPALEAREGSRHGYDVTDPGVLRRELGGEDGFRRLVRAARRSRLAIMMDIVPNHMAADGANPWWRDVLEFGRQSPYADWFDIDWEGRSGGAPGRLRLPILGDDLRAILERGELRLGLDREGLHLRYWQARFPLAPDSYSIVLAEALEELRRRLGRRHRAARDLSDVLVRAERYGARFTRSRVETPAAEALRRSRHAAISLKGGLRRFQEAHPEARLAILRALARIVRGPRLDSRERLLGRILARQHYRLVFWKRGPDTINFRRFFNVADLVALRVERRRVFEERHALLSRMIRDGWVDAVRVDHVDGLRDPETYLKRLRRLVGPSRPIVVEKILTGSEKLPKEWPVDGTTGYDFLAHASFVGVDPEGVASLGAGWAGFVGSKESFEQVRRGAKRDVAEMHFSGEVRALAVRLAMLTGNGLCREPVTPDEAETVLLSTLSAFPVYRTYCRAGEMRPEDRKTVRRAIRDARRGSPKSLAAAWTALRRVLLLELPETGGRAMERKVARFVERWQLLTAPVQAKGVEDTAFYRFVPLASLNEVGAEPQVPADPVASFHRFMGARRRDYPTSLNATTTHDTKRGEDVRARLSVLSEMAGGWLSLVVRWHRMNRYLRTTVGGRSVPLPAEEVLFYQTLVGAWPAEGPLGPGFRRRLREFMWKAAREAKVATSWLHPDPAHEEALAAFVLRALRTSGNNPFLRDVSSFQRTVARVGAWNGLAQVVLKVAAPGVPDVYQGAEGWDLRLVDPDNRGPVPFGRNARALTRLIRRGEKDRAGLVRDLVARWEDGRIKTYVLRESLRLRRQRREVFERGAYAPLRASGARSGNLLAFARRHGDRWALAATPRLVARWCVSGSAPVGPGPWSGSDLILPAKSPDRYRNVFTDERVVARKRGRERGIPLQDVFRICPVALFVEENP